MSGGMLSDLPENELRQLDFLIGESSGLGMMHPPESEAIQLRSYLTVARESCERFLRLDFYGNIPTLGIESVHSLISYSRKHGAYRMWSFAASQEDPLILTGNWQGRSLVFVSEPTEMFWGYQRMRFTFTNIADGVLSYCSELWTIDGYTPYFEALYSMHPVHI